MPRSTIIAIAIAAALSGCGEGNKYVAPPPPKVTVAQPVQKQITRYLEATGNAAAVNSANLVARVQGYLQDIKYKDGDEVKQGAPLFVIEPETYRLKAEQMRAAQDGAEASLKQLEADYQRQVDLAARQVASKATLDQALAARDGGKAKVQQAEVDSKTAEINYGYTTVSAPFDGVVTARQVSLGELVGGGTSPTVLATIVQLNPIHVNFNISEPDVLRVRASLAQRGIRPGEVRGRVPVEIGLQNETGYPHQGVIDYAAPNVDPSTGTLAVRALLQNEHRELLPGFFARVRVPLPQENQQALLLPDTALGSDQGGRYVLVVNADSVVEQRKVTTGPLVDGLRVIETGLKPEDRIVVGGLVRAIPGQKVDPQTQTASAVK